MKKMKIPRGRQRKTPGKVPRQNVFRPAEQTPSSPFKSGMPVSDNDAARCCSHYLISRNKRRRMTR